jgi:Raf kinase inhibitor-like YbhB/YbcL family protein
MPKPMRTLVLGMALAAVVVPALAAGFTVTTPDFANGGTIAPTQIFNAGGCMGKNRSPALSWSGEPAGTRSFAVTMFDPDTPTGHGWWHWTVFNIPPGVHSLAADAGAAGSRLLPEGAGQGRTDFGFSHYGGPCPPAGNPPHHYEVTVYALNTAKLPLDANAPGVAVAAALRAATLATARITGLYGRPR